MPLSKSESVEVENSEVSLENSGYKSIQIRFLALDDVDKYNVYFSQENFNRTTDATLHSRILVQDDISSLSKFNSQNTLSACWFSTDGSYDVNSIHFSYKDGTKIFNGFSIDIKPNIKTAIIGKSGSGKSTLMKLLMGFYHVTKGEISIDGINISKFPLSYLRKSISYVNQNTTLFTD